MIGYKREVDLSYVDAVQKTREVLAKEGFGIITEIDVKATLKKKLNVDFGNYIILGACNPALAHKALQAELDIGLMLPCNVIVYEKEGRTYAVATTPTVVSAHFSNPKLTAVAEEVEQLLQKVIDSV